MKKKLLKRQSLLQTRDIRFCLRSWFREEIMQNHILPSPRIRSPEKWKFELKVISLEFTKWTEQKQFASWIYQDTQSNKFGFYTKVSCVIILVTSDLGFHNLFYCSQLSNLKASRQRWSVSCHFMSRIKMSVSQTKVSKKWKYERKIEIKN